MNRIEYQGMSYEQASRRAELIIKRDGWFDGFVDLEALRHVMLRHIENAAAAKGAMAESKVKPISEYLKAGGEYLLANDLRYDRLLAGEPLTDAMWTECVEDARQRIALAGTGGASG